MFPIDRRTFVLGAAAAAASLALPVFPALAQSVDTADLHAPGPLGNHVLGSEDAPVTVVEYASMTCPHCGHFARETYEAFKEKYVDTGQVRFIFREFPLDQVAYGISMLANCAPAERYFDVTHAFFERQDDWMRSEQLFDAVFGIAQQFGFTKESFEACLSNQALFEDLDEVKQRGVSFGVDATPTFFINGEKHAGALTIEQLDEIIQPML